MTKLTKDILLKKGLPKSHHLKDVQKLNLSKMQLESKDIDVQLLSQMQNLEELDISKNNLSELPGKLGLPKLRVLNFSDNQVEEVTILKQFPSLEEVMYEENLYLTVSDNYKLCCLLPKLRRLNNKDITSLANHVRFVNHRELSSRVESYWEKNYKEKLPDEPTRTMIKSVSKEFLKSVGNHVKYGPNSLKDFTKWKVQIIAENLISSYLGEKKEVSGPEHEQVSSRCDAAKAPVTSSKKQTQNTETEAEVRPQSKRLRSNAETECEGRTPSKRLQSSAETECEGRTPSKRLRSSAETECEGRTPSKRLRSSAETECEGRTPSKRLQYSAETEREAASPTKRLKSSDVLAIVLSPRRSSKSQETPKKSTPVKGKQDTPVKEKALRMPLTPTRLSLKATPVKQGVDRALTNGKEKKGLRKKKQFDLEPIHFLQSHSKNNDSDDFRTQLWSCAFEPTLDSSRSSKVIATCGGESVCVIDCETGKVLKKYKVPGEEFFTLAWTTLTMICKEGQKREINVLAAGGRFGIVKLMHPKVGLCYGEIKAHKKAISIMCFSPTQDTFLFTGSYDKRIILWDIGVPDYEYNFRSSQLLTLDTTSTPLRLCPVPASPDQHLMAACEDGCFVWDITLKKQQARRSYDVEINFPIYNKESKDSDFHIVDGLAFLSDDLVVSKSAMQGSIYIWSWKKSFEKQKSKNSKKAAAYILAEQKWSETDLPYLALTTSTDGYCVLCGDEAGKIWIYELESCKAELQTGVPCKTLKEPTKIIDWPYPIAKKEKVEKSVINTVVMDPAMEYLVALTDKNIIAIWKIL
ncbi:leucine-rich repeat and WD repeat-containing protein 1 [Hyla sarda]|uniref:leucine-rich repeat and WD repeat-containing protein 1 n=1 Tax=Hyla sarda TaxID=327740 RepID=UPI0024C2F082|nr:leucine-rich repeat and WD repeat-containing protein 1 [Hyla sarda]